MVIVTTEKSAAVEQLQLATEREKELQEQISQMTVDLQSFKAELESARQNISSIELRIKSKKHSIHWLRQERDGCIDELEAEYGRHRATLERLTLFDAKSAFVRAEAESAKKALSLAIENFKNFEEFKEEILEDRYASYCIRYEDG